MANRESKEHRTTRVEFKLSVDVSNTDNMSAKEIMEAAIEAWNEPGGHHECSRVDGANVTQLVHSSWAPEFTLADLVHFHKQGIPLDQLAFRVKQLDKPNGAMRYEFQATDGSVTLDYIDAMNGPGANERNWFGWIVDAINKSQSFNSGVFTMYLGEIVSVTVKVDDIRGYRK